VRTPHTYDYAVLRVVPRVERGEFINAGVVLWCAGARFLGVQLALDEAVLQALDPEVDLPQLHAALTAIDHVCRGGESAGALGRLPARDRFHWLVAQRSTIIQTSPVHTGYCHDPQQALERLTNTMVRRRSGGPGQALSVDGSCG